MINYHTKETMEKEVETWGLEGYVMPDIDLFRFLWYDTLRMVEWGLLDETKFKM